MGDAGDGGDDDVGVIDGDGGGGVGDLGGDRVGDDAVGADAVGVGIDDLGGHHVHDGNVDYVA